MQNLFSPNPNALRKEQFDTLLKTQSVSIEKITSNGQTSSRWYDQSEDEWVVIIEGEATLLFEDGRELPLQKGEHLYIPKNTKHKVTYTASPTIWLAVHFA
ncbi:MAG: cupin domain-containing protein [Campylobacterales bacterium]|nr:cupin domain-containing protein [Campylobacterales bacterium]